MATTLELYTGNISLSYSKSCRGIDFGFLLHQVGHGGRRQDQIG